MTDLTKPVLLVAGFGRCGTTMMMMLDREFNQSFDHEYAAEAILRRSAECAPDISIEVNMT